MTDRTRFSGIFDAQEWGVSVIGLGGIGAPTVLTLAKMGFGNIKGFDRDEVESENTGPQLYGPDDVGFQKAEACMENARYYADDIQLQGYCQWISETTNWRDLANPIVISAVDSITARHNIWAAICGRPWLWYIDARMSAEELVLHIVNGDDREWYADLLAGQNEAEVPDLSCTSKATIYCGFGAAAYLGAVCRKIVTNQSLPRIIAVSFVHFGMVKV